MPVTSQRQKASMDIPITQLLSCGHDPDSVIIVAEKHGYYRLRCPECGAESRKREAPEWFWKALADDGEEAEGEATEPHN